MMLYLPNIWRKYKKWCRLLILLQTGGMSVFKNVITKIDSSQEIYKQLKNHRKEIKGMYKNQQEIRLPDGGKTKIGKLDITLSAAVIRMCDTSKILEETKKQNIQALKDKRNALFHKSMEAIDMMEEVFDKSWNEIEKLLRDLGYNINVLKGLKTNDHLKEEYEAKFVESLPLQVGHHPFVDVVCICCCCCCCCCCHLHAPITKTNDFRKITDSL